MPTLEEAWQASDFFGQDRQGHIHSCSGTTGGEPPRSCREGLCEEEGDGDVFAFLGSMTLELLIVFRIASSVRFTSLKRSLDSFYGIATCSWTKL